MDRRERLDDSIEVGVLASIQGMQASMWTAMPGIITKFDRIKMTAEVRPAIQGRVRRPNGSVYWRDLPQLVDCPVVFPSGGGFTLTFPVAAGDECLVVFSSRSIDSWWGQGNPAPASDLRMHDLSDGFVLVGARSKSKAEAVNMTEGVVELRNATRTAFVQIDAGGSVKIKSSATITIDAPSIVLTGSVTNNGKNIGSTHVHTGVQAGGATSGPPP